MLVVAVEKRQPLVIFFEPRFFHIAKIGTAFTKIGLNDLKVLLSQLQFEPRDLARCIELAKTLVLAFDVELDILALRFQIHFGRRQLTPGQSDVGRTLRGHQRDSNLETYIEIVSLKSLKEILKVVEPGK